jgi:hypothetical protein
MRRKIAFLPAAFDDFNWWAKENNLRQPSLWGSDEELSEAMEDYCLSKAMDEAQGTPLLSREEALAYLEA